MKLNRVPAAKSLFGALEVVGRPVKTTKGINVAYRLDPEPALQPELGRAQDQPQRRRRQGREPRGDPSRAQRAATRSTPVSGSVSISGGGSGRSGSLRSVRILPGKTVNFDLTARRGLRAGSYTATVTLSQGGKSAQGDAQVPHRLSGRLSRRAPTSAPRG